MEFDRWRVDNGPIVSICRGKDGCGALVHPQDEERHKTWHSNLVSALLLNPGANE